MKTKAIASDRGSGNDISFVMLWGFISSRFVCLFSECQKSTTKLMVRFSVCMSYLETEKNPLFILLRKHLKDSLLSFQKEQVFSDFVVGIL